MNLIQEDLKRWFKEKWTAQDGGECGSYEGKGRVKCRPSKKVSSKTPKTWGEMSKKEKKKAVRQKQKAHKKGHQFSSHETGETWKAKKGKYSPSVKEEWNPKNKKKHSACKSKIKSKVKVWPSAYASGLLVQCYKKKSKKKVEESFRNPPLIPKQNVEVDDKKAIVDYLKGAVKNPMRFYYLLLLAGRRPTEAQRTMYNLKFPMVRTSNIKTRKKMMGLLTRLIDVMVTDPIIYARLRSLAMKGQLEGVDVQEDAGMASGGPAMSIGNSSIPFVSATKDGSIETPPIMAMPPRKRRRKQMKDLANGILQIMFRTGDKK